MASWLCVVNLEQKKDDQKQNIGKTFLIALLQWNCRKFWMFMFGKPKWTLKFDAIIIL